MDYTPDWNLASIPDDVLFKHAGLRMAARRSAPAKKFSLCPHCGQPFGVADMRIHKPDCNRAKKLALSAVTLNPAAHIAESSGTKRTG